jgi:predicted ATPase
MSSIMIRDLAHSASLDRHAMAAVRGGTSWGQPDVTVNVNLKQQIAQVQDIDLNVLNNNGVIGAGFSGPTIKLSPEQWAKNEAVLTGF